MRNKNTLESLGIWESVYNSNLNYGEFAIIKSQAGLNSYKLSVKEWGEKTNAIGLKATAGRYGGTFAHKDIAFEFASWISIEFKLYIIKEFQRLKENLIPKEITKQQADLVYANEADLLNTALFGITVKE
ncbi:KilA-N domain-containing protein [Sphingobacterium sp. ML3W]|uniref:KilA-N domain-containing protein n=1 Tax=Sphingobacterium sp. ML3W TaxID=1538644 RepID=UPI000AEA526A|nr:KilA-N domain-containing protein [Sphingobacterium sp. ML3W]